jgi:hypothetical protein
VGVFALATSDPDVTTWVEVTQPSDNLQCAITDRTGLGATDTAGAAFTEASCKAFCEATPECEYAVFHDSDHSCFWCVARVHRLARWRRL